MRKSYKYIFTLAAAFLFGTAAYGQGGQTVTPKDPSEGIVVTKTATDNHDGTYTLTLESFVTGYQSNTITHVVHEVAVPLDVVLVLDVSGSMDEEMNSYVARPSQGYSYNNSIGTIFTGTTDYYYLYNGQYYNVYWDHDGLISWNNFVLYFTANGTRYYLSGNGITTSAPTNYDDASDIIYTGVLYGRTRMDALKAACSSFIDNIAAKAAEDDVEHRIAVVTFASEASTVSGLSTNYNGLKSAINQLSANGATGVDYGLQNAQTIINGIPSSRESAKLVVMFTDGSPTHSSGFENDVANAAISTSRTLKSADVKVYSVGTLESDAGNIGTYMNYVSSNYPNATSMTNGGTQADSKYYMNTTDASELENIFSTIAQEESNTGTAIGGEDVSLTQGDVVLNDVITPHFVLPDDGSNSVEIYALACTGATKIEKDGQSYNNHPAPILIDDEGHVWYGAYTWATTPTAIQQGEGADDVRINTAKAENGFTTVSIENYDFAGHWVGLEEEIEVAAGSGTETIKTSAPHGQKLVIKITIVPNPESEGGRVTTNGEDSGLYVGEDELSDIPIISIPVPENEIYTPMNLEIKVAGLNDGETALFEISRSSDTNKMVVAVTGSAGSNSSSVAKLPVKKWNADTNQYDTIIYTVKELTDWTWKYNNSAPVLTQDLLTDNIFEFTVSENAANSAKAKHDESSKNNIFTQTVAL